MKSYVFILCPPYSGSTLLWKLVSTSDAVSSLPKEGQFLPEVRKVMRRDPWNSNEQFPWETIKEVWNKYWDPSKPLLLEKSPPNIIRTREIIEHFSPIYFLLMVRNPYAHCESLMRRNKVNAEEAAEFTLRCMRQQAENVANLDVSLAFTYEALVQNPKLIAEKIQSFIPQIGELQYDKKFETRAIDGIQSRKIVDFNQKKIDNLSLSDLDKINRALGENKDIMEYWGYEFYTPPPQHGLIFIKTRSQVWFSKGWRFARKTIRETLR
ncbi:MAG: sulfotransferase [Cyanobacteriota bacterium]|nr:sulfotransferase [Cyanobacteriota bacterium]